MPSPVLHEGLRPTVGHLVHTTATRGGCTGGDIFPTTLLAYPRATYPQSLTSKYGLGGRLHELELD